MKNKAKPMNQDDLKYIAGLVASMPDVEPPETLINSIMGHIRPKRLSLLRRAWLKMQSPFSVTPFKIISVGASIVIILFFAGLFLRDSMDKKVSWVAPGSQQGSFKTVIFTLDLPHASRVEVIGSFNRWTPGVFNMHWDEHQKVWSLALQLEGGKHEYAFLVDGKRVLQDPKALLHQEDGFGNKNSVLIIERNNGHETEI
ncbi:glycogen-binding domain-containing protein [Thermodesulfobacteriota bacterium]